MEKVAVVGLGNIATRHRRNLKTLYPQALLYAMSASGRIPEEAVPDCDLMVSSVDKLIAHKVNLVIVASPASFHACHSIPLIEAGIPVLIEKPMTADLADSLSIQDAINKSQTPVAIGYCLRYLSSSMLVKALLDENKIGQLYNASIEVGQYLPDWRPTKSYLDSVSASVKLGGGALLELSHELDYTQWLLGPIAVKHAILRSSAELRLEVEDSVDILATTEHDAIVTIHLDFLQRKAHRKCRFVGNKGALEWDLIQNEVVFFSSSGVETLYSEPQWDKNQMYLEMVTDFVHQINGVSDRSATIPEAIRTVNVIEQIKKNFPICKLVTPS